MTVARAFSFVQITDLHVGIPVLPDLVAPLSDDLRQIEREVGDRAAFIALTGDLTNRGTESQCRLYLEAVKATRMKIHPVVGNHDYSCGEPREKQQWNAAWYRKLIAPLNYSFDFNGVHFVSYDYTGREPGDWPAPLPIDFDQSIPSDWLIDDLSAQPANTPIILLIHDQKNAAFFEKLKRFRIVATISGHWHSSRLYHDGRIAHYNSSALCFGGIDYSPRSYRLFTWDQEKLACETVPLRKSNPPTISSGRAAEWLWKSPLTGQVHLGSPVVAEGRVFLGLMDENCVNQGAIACWDAATGEALWRAPLDASVKNSVVVHAGKVIGVSITGEVAAFDARQGKRVWTYQLGDPSERWIFSSPVVGNGCVFTGQGPHFAALKADSGKPLWVRTDLTKSDWISSYATPVSDGLHVYIGFFWQPGCLYALSAETGQTIWKIAPSPNEPYAVSPLVLDGTGGLLGVLSNGITKRAAATGSIQWLFPFPNPWNPAAPAVEAGLVYAVCGAGEVWAIDANTGKQIWRWECRNDLAEMQPYQRAAKTILASPKLLGNLLLVSVNDGRLVALDKRTGKPRWEHDFGAPVTSSPALAEGKIFLAVGDGNLYAFDADKLPY